MKGLWFLDLVPVLIKLAGKGSDRARPRAFICTEYKLIYDWFEGAQNKFNSY